MTLHKQNNNDGEMENQTNEKMIRKSWKKWTLWNREESISFLLMIGIHIPLEAGGSKDHWKEVGSDGLFGRLL